MSCGAGYLLKNGKCEDIDECFEGTHQCHMTATCKDTDGSYDCTCPLGYSGGTNAGFACAPRIAVGSEHACVLLLDGTVQCWGKNSYGELGDGSQSERTVPVAVRGLRDAVILNAGGDHTCAIVRDGTVSCWGSNAYGKLGDGTTMNRAAPVAVAQVENAVALDAFNSHVCVVARTGAVKCWGENGDGQLGTGTASTEPSMIPVGAKGIASASGVFVGQAQTCAVLQSGATQCWGQGFLGIGAISSSLAPVTIAIPGGVRSIAFGYRHACSVHLSGHVYCWGAAAAGGNGIASGDGPPSIVTGAAALAVSAGFYSSYTIKPDRTLAWWDLGTRPSEPSGFGRVVAMDAYLAQGRALTEDGRVISWTVNNPTAGAMLTQPVFVAGLDLW